MPDFQPFRGLRYNLDLVDLAAVSAPPYDVIDDELRAELGRRHPDNIVHVDLPQDPDGGDPYRRAAALLAEWREKRILVEEDAPAFYVYSMTYEDDRGRARETTGVIGALALSRPGEGGILPHEHTTPKAKTDRLELLRACHANLSPVWGLSAADGLTAAVAGAAAELAAWTDDDGVGHRLARLDDPDAIEAVRAAVASAPVVVADGHHRYETSLAYRDEHPELAGAATVMIFVVELSEDQLTVGPIHRLLSGLPDDVDLASAFAPFFDVRPIDDLDETTIGSAQIDAGALVLVTRQGTWWLTPKPEAMTAARDLDSSRLDVALAALPDHDLTFQHGVANVMARVSKGDAQAGVLLRPATVGQIIEIAHGGERMPPKTTFFYPKLRTGLVLRPVD